MSAEKILTPKEQALELFNQHEDYSECTPSSNWKRNTVKSALITVDKLILHKAKAPFPYEIDSAYWEAVRLTLENMIKVEPIVPPSYTDWKEYYLAKKPDANDSDIQKLFDFYTEKGWLKNWKIMIDLKLNK